MHTLVNIFDIPINLPILQALLRPYPSAMTIFQQQFLINPLKFSITHFLTTSATFVLVGLLLLSMKLTNYFPTKQITTAAIYE